MPIISACFQSVHVVIGLAAANFTTLSVSFLTPEIAQQQANCVRQAEYACATGRWLMAQCPIAVEDLQPDQAGVVQRRQLRKGG